MKTADVDINLINLYYDLLKSLSTTNKLVLIERLKDSIETPKKIEDDSWKSLFGALDLDQSAEEFAKDLKNERKFNRKSINF